MNRTTRSLTRTRASAGWLPFLPFLVLLSVFLPLPFVVLPVLFFISLIILPRAAPREFRFIPLGFLSPPPLRSPPA
jgi:O-antigen ligase